MKSWSPSCFFRRFSRESILIIPSWKGSWVCWSWISWSQNPVGIQQRQLWSWKGKSRSAKFALRSWASCWSIKTGNVFPSMVLFYILRVFVLIANWDVDCLDVPLQVVEVLEEGGDEGSWDQREAGFATVCATLRNMNVHWTCPLFLKKQRWRNTLFPNSKPCNWIGTYDSKDVYEVGSIWTCCHAQFLWHFEHLLSEKAVFCLYHSLCAALAKR